MLRGIAQVAIGISVVGGMLWIAFAVSFRTKFRPVQNTIRRMNRAVLNPLQLRKAGRPGAYASVVHHVGRTSGASYRTPVVAMPAEQDFVIALPYGPGADWVRNVLANGTATIEREGQTVQVAQPEVVPASDANPHFPPGQQRTHRLYGINDFLLLRSARAARSEEPRLNSSH